MPVTLPRLIGRFPLWWYLDRPRWFLRLARNLIYFLDRQLAVSLMARLWLTPLFGDPNLVGHAIAVLFRTFRIVGGIFIILTVEIVLGLVFLFFLAVPFLSLTTYFWIWAPLPLLVFLWYLRTYQDLPERLIQGEEDLKGDPRLFLRPSLAAFILQAEDEAELLKNVCQRSVPRRLLLKLGFASTAEFVEAANNHVEKIRHRPLENLLQEAQKIAGQLGDQKIASPHLLLAMLQKMDFKADDFREVLVWSNDHYRRHHPPRVWHQNYRPVGLGGFNRSWTGRATYALDRFSRDLTREAQEGRLPPLLGKEKALDQALRVLERRAKNHVLLLGHPGCGKTTLVLGIAQEIVRGTENPALSDKRLVMLDLSKLQAGAKTAGELQERIHAVLDDIEGSGNIILFIDEIQNAVIGGGSAETSVVFGAFVQRMEAGRFQVIGASGWDGFRKYIEPNVAFARLFERVEIAEASAAETLKILEYVGGELEEEQGVVVTIASLRESIELSQKYIHERVLPDKAVDLLEETVAQVAREKRPVPLVLPQDVESLVSEKTGVPVSRAGREESKELLNLEEKIHQRLINQSEAVTAVADAIRRARVGLRDEKRPIASLLFVGPTGVGKTETAKALAEVFYGREEKMIRFDMSEFQTEAAVDSFIAKVSDGVYHKPFSLVLFDEVDKASRGILDIFLAVIEDGRLTSNSGQTVSFANCLLVFTSNAGTSFIFDCLRAGRGVGEFKKDLFKRLEKSFRLEFLNRFDGIIVYQPLSPEQMEMIARLKLKKIAVGLEKEGYKISFADDLVKVLALQGYDAALGARPLRRLIQDKVEATLAKKILSGQIEKDKPFTFSLEVNYGGID